LADLFRGRSQLLICHFMFGPDYTAGCPACSAIADGFNGFVVHLASHCRVLMASPTSRPSPSNPIRSSVGCRGPGPGRVLYDDVRQCVEVAQVFPGFAVSALHDGHRDPPILCPPCE